MRMLPLYLIALAVITFFSIPLCFGLIHIGSPVTANIRGTVSSTDNSPIENPVIIVTSDAEAVFRNGFFMGECSVLFPQTAIPPVTSFNYSTQLDTTPPPETFRILVISDSHAVFSSSLEWSRSIEKEIVLRPR